LLFAAVFIGIGRAAQREGLQHAGSSPWARGKLAEHVLAINAAEGFLHSVCTAETWPMPARLLDRVQQVKTFVTQMAVQAATQSAMISGGRCYVAHHPLYRMLSDALAGPLLRPPLAAAMDSLSERLETAF
jgi:alkylation response protein AidB-like acyl-CoA dehydrogenase